MEFFWKDLNKIIFSCFIFLFLGGIIGKVFYIDFVYLFLSVLLNCDRDRDWLMGYACVCLKFFFEKSFYGIIFLVYG